MYNSICAVIVTYGDRFRYLSKVVDSVLKNGISKIIVVDNASARNSGLKLQELAKSLAGKLKVIRLKRNMGSAGGFKKGIEEALKCKECEYILLLDDDNILQDGFYKNLVNIVKRYGKQYPKNLVAFSSYRPSLSQCENLKVTMNTFWGFHIKHIPKKIRRLFLSNRNKTKVSKCKSKEIIPVDTAPYGGLFFHKSLIDKFGLPNDQFVLYEDDCEFTYRITSRGGLIFLTIPCVIIDAQVSSGGEAKLFNLGTYAAISKSKLYYSIRNFSYLETYCKKNGFMRRINKWVYLFLLGMYLFLRKKSDRFKLIMEAINDGEQGKLGYNEKYPLL